jgi:hypothetical protein
MHHTNISIQTYTTLHKHQLVAGELLEIFREDNPSQNCIVGRNSLEEPKHKIPFISPYNAKFM